MIRIIYSLITNEDDVARDRNFTEILAKNRREILRYFLYLFIKFEYVKLYRKQYAMC